MAAAFEFKADETGAVAMEQWRHHVELRTHPARTVDEGLDGRRWC